MYDFGEKSGENAFMMVVGWCNRCMVSWGDKEGELVVRWKTGGGENHGGFGIAGVGEEVLQW